MTRRSLSVQTVVVGLAAALLLAVVMSAWVWGRPGSSRYSETPERSVDGREIWYDNPQAIAKSSDLVVRARVTATSKGRTYSEGQGDEYTSRYVDLEILETFKGAEVFGSSIRMEEEGWDAEGVGYVVNGLQWSHVGEEGYYFLSPLDGGTYGQRGSFGRILTTGEEVGPSGHEPDRAGPWKGLTSQLEDPAEIRVVILDAIDKSSE
ncbi:exported hypothetical protein [metagenome]|uniref:Uncharacterized protein n=1 Tax=metagenome TaxID=256318 RepID=A0A2P2C603_9ZZZZ